MQTIVHQQQDILNELRIISSASQKSAEQARRKSRVNELTAMVLAQNPYRSWTAAAVGREIKVTGQAVGRCDVWKEYCRIRAAEKAEAGKSLVKKDGRERND